MSKTKTTAPETTSIDSVLEALDAIETTQLAKVTGGVGGEGGGEVQAIGGQLGFSPHNIRN